MSTPQPVSGHKGRDRWMCALAAASDLSTMAIRLTLRLCVSFNCKTGQCDPGYPKLAGDMAVSKRTVSRAIDELETAGWISVDRTGGDNTRNAQINLLIPGAGETRSDDNMLSPEKEPTGATSDDNMLSPENPSLQVTENAPSGDRNGGFQVTDRVAAQITCEPENLKSPAVPAAGRTSRVDRESVTSNSAKTTDDETPIQRAVPALIEPVADQQQPPLRASPNMGRVAASADPAAEAMRWVQFLNVLRHYPPERVCDEGEAYEAFRAVIEGRRLRDVIEAIQAVVRCGGHLPPLAHALACIGRDQARRTGRQ